MGRFETSVAFVAGKEGGLADHKSDKGGRTGYGVTQGTYDRYRASKKLDKRDVHLIGKSEVLDIYREYWTSSYAGAFDLALATVALDTAWLFGVGRWKQFFREATGINISGRLSEQAKARITSLTPSQEKKTALMVVSLRKMHHRKVCEKDPSQTVFYRGWMRRSQSLEKFVLENSKL